MVLDWIKQIEDAALALEEKPQFGGISEFSWEQFESELKEVFEAPSLTCGHVVKGWVDPQDLRKGIGKNPRFLHIFWEPLPTPVFFVTTEQDIRESMAIFLGGEEEASFFDKENLVSPFFDYLAAQMLHLLQKMGFGGSLAPRLGENFAPSEEPQLDEPCFIVDAALSVKNMRFWGRILIPKSFREEWKRFFSGSFKPALSQEMKQKLFLDVSLEAGHTFLSLEDWKKARVGDFVLLDYGTFNPEENRGSLLLTLDGKPLFRARYKEGTVKITHYPAYEEVRNMEKKMGDEDIYGDKELDEDFLQDFPEEEAESQEGSLEERGLDLNELPIQLTVEVARLKISVQDLMNLSPGNTLDLQVAPEQGVDLVINGKKVGKGELIRMGEVLGVRILSL